VASRNAKPVPTFAGMLQGWVSWALGDFSVKMLVALTMLAPYGLLRLWIADRVLHPAK
ncbi:hypothetical protein MNBD_ALPHA12-1729, partial [hydrothermal vent metagenome]